MLALCGPTSNGVEQPSIPLIARIARVQVGYTTMPGLEARLGPGKPITGGHANGARLWRVKGTHWIIYADAFEYSSRGIVVDSFWIHEDLKPNTDVPFARISLKELSWLGTISLKMTQDKLMQAMNANSLPAEKTVAGWEVHRPGSYALSEYVRFRVWTAELDVTNKVLVGIRLDAH